MQKYRKYVRSLVIYCELFGYFSEQIFVLREEIVYFCFVNQK